AWRWNLISKDGALKAPPAHGSSAMSRIRIGVFFVSCAAAAAAFTWIAVAQVPNTRSAESSLWKVYADVLVHAKYVDLTHTITPAIPVWRGFGRSHFAPAVNPQTGKPYSYKDDGFEATQYELATDQLGTQL